MFIILWDVKKPAHLSQRVGNVVPGVVVCLLWYIMVGKVKRADLIWSLALLCDHSCGESYSKFDRFQLSCETSFTKVKQLTTFVTVATIAGVIKTPCKLVSFGLVTQCLVSQSETGTSAPSRSRPWS